MAMNVDEIVKLAEQLSQDQQNVLIYRLRVKRMQEREAAQPMDELQLVEHASSPTREALLREVALLRNTPARTEDHLLGKYANPNIPDMTEEAFHAELYAIATEWEQELDEFSSDES